MFPSWVLMPSSRLEVSLVCWRIESMREDTFWRESAADAIGCPIEANVLPTDEKGLEPPIEIPDNVCPTPVTVEPIVVRLLAIDPVSWLVADKCGYANVCAELKKPSVPCVWFMASRALVMALSALARAFDVVF